MRNDKNMIELMINYFLSNAQSRTLTIYPSWRFRDLSKKHNYERDTR